jgi:hypothetical protein
MRRLAIVMLFCSLTACDKGPSKEQLKAITQHKLDQSECSQEAHKSSVQHPADASKVVSDKLNECMRARGYHIPGGQK